MAFRYLITLCALVAYAQAGLLAVANPSVDAVASTQQNVVRSFAGTVSSYSKAVDTPYSSVRKSDTRIQNNVYTPALAKTTYAAPLYTQATPVVAKTLVHAPVVQKTVYAAPAPVYASAPVYAAHAPVVAKTVYSAPAPVVAKTVYSAPAPVYAAPAPVYAKTVYSAPAPVVAKTVYSAPAPVYAPAPVVTKAVYAAPAPVLAKTVSYGAPLATTNVNHGPSATTYTHNAPALGVSSYGSAQTVQYSPATSVSHMSFDGFGTHWGF
ncbi:larval/pupal cuticle protein H1C [Drosophila obscura]|uniref:larval/pupal cuticle protein H1C n=1 Tax=Drosophila obscura TaxID=7282 RepID=UPI001BB24F93|nr:larval/pupal cuticle protein H1C [Drosophila obscura]